MPNAISNLLSRRNRKASRETDLDDVWGDVQITSPTDSSQTPQSEDPKLDAYLTQLSLLGWSGEMPSTRSPSLNQHALVSKAANTPNTAQLPDNCNPTNSSTDLLRSRPTLTLMASNVQSQRRWHPTRIVTPPEHPTHVAENTQPRPSRGSWSKEDYFAYVSANEPSSTLSPPLSDASETPIQSHKVDLLATETIESHRKDSLSRMAISSNDFSDPPRNRNPLSSNPYEQKHTARDLQSNRPLPDRIETFYSSTTMDLSPVCEGSVTSEVEQLRDDITVLEDELRDYTPASPMPPALVVEQLSATTRNPPELSHVMFHAQQSSRHTSINPSVRGHSGLSPIVDPPSPRSHLRVPSENQFGQGIGITFGSADAPLIAPVPMLPVSTITAITDIYNSGPLSPPIFGQSVVDNRLSSGDCKPSPSIEGSKDSQHYMKSPPLGVTGMMRAQAPPLGVTQAMRKYSPRIGTVPDEESRSRVRHPRWVDRPKPASLLPQSLHKGLRQRSASIEPLASPSFFNSSGPTTPGSTVSTISPPFVKTPASSSGTFENKCTCTCAIHRHHDESAKSPKMIEAARYARKYSKENKSKLHNRSASHAIPTSPDVYRWQRSMESPQFAFESGSENVSNTRFHNEAGNDYRRISYGTVASNDEDRLAQVDEAIMKKQQSLSLKARFASRPGDPSVQRKSSGDSRANLDQQINAVSTHGQRWF